MSLKSLKSEVLLANQALKKENLVVLTWGNVSFYDPISGYVIIKPSGVSYEDMKEEDMVVVDLEANLIEGHLRPSSDTLTHLEIYKNFEGVHAVVHTHSKWATIFCQAQLEIPIYGTTHADYFSHPIPLARQMLPIEIEKDYEKNTGRVIVETFDKRNISPLTNPAILLQEHGPFVWGKDLSEALENAVVLETIAEMAYYTMHLKKDASTLQVALKKKHYERKHGKDAYYGQKK